MKQERVGMVLTSGEILELIDGAWSFADPAGSERRFIAASAGATGNAELHAALLSQRARAVGLQRKFAEADALLDQAEMLAGGAGAEDAGAADARTLSRVLILMERGRVRNSAGDKDAATPLFEAAFEAAVAGGLEALAVDAAHMLGIVVRGERGMAWNVRAMEIAQASPDPRARRWVASLSNNIGWHYHDHADYARALECFQVALTAREAAGQVEPILVARWCVGRCLRSLGRLAEALELQRELEAEHDRRGTPDGFVQEELGECLLGMHKPDAARPHFAAAHRLLSQDPWLAQSEPRRLARLAELGWGAN